MKRCYVAGALSSNDACIYLQNVSKMMNASEHVRRLGLACYTPAIDLLMGIKFGWYEYDDYFVPSQAWLDVSDCLFLTSGWEASKGTIREIDRACKKDIPVFSDLEQIEEFVKPLVICIVGESGVGKTLMAETFESLFHYNLIQSYTTRPKRNPEENGHTFITEEQFDKFIFDKREMIAYTKFGAFRYCCLRDDVLDYNTYVIDEFGLDYLNKNYSEQFHIYSVRIRTNDRERKLRTSLDRYNRDKGKFTKDDSEFDFVFKNKYDMKEMLNFVKVTKNQVWTDFINKCQNQ
jgi:guanylate kinase